MARKFLKKFRSNKPKRVHVHEATDCAIHHAEPDNAGTPSTSAATGQTVHTNDRVPTDQHDSTMSPWKKVTWNATKITLELMNQVAAFPPLQTTAGLLLSLVNHYELTSTNKISIQSVAARIQRLNDSIVQHGSYSDPGDLERQKRLKTRLTKICDDLQLLLAGNVVKRFLNSADDAGKLSGSVEDIRDAITEYQVSLQQDLYFMNCQHFALDLLDKLLRSKDAEYRSASGDRQPCLNGTRVELLQELEDWGTSTDDFQIFWLDGMAGTGKSTIAQSFAKRLSADGILGASFFFSRDIADRSDIKLLFPTIAFQLAYRLPKFHDALVNIIKADPDVGRLSLVDQLEKLLVDPLKSLAAIPDSDIPRFIVIVLDALDECKDPEPESTILSLLSKYVEEIPFIRFFVTSRPEHAIRSVFHRTLKYRTKELVLQDVDRAPVDSDIRMYLTTRLSDVANRCEMNVDVPWPSLQDLDIMVHKCSGLFIYASTIVKFIQSRLHVPRDRLKIVTSMPDSDSGEGKSIIDPLYTRVLEDGFAEIESDEDAYFDELKLVIAAVLLAIDPLPRLTIATLLDMDPLKVTSFLGPLYSVLQVSPDDTHAIHRLHKSFPDFITDPKRCKNSKFHIDLPIYHGKMAFLCLELMKKRLERNICKIPPYTMNRDFEDLDARRKEFVGDALEYACRFWTHHVSLASKTGQGIILMLDWLKDFFEHRFILWIEILIILEDLGIAMYSLRGVQEWLQSVSVPTQDLQNLITDCQRFVLQFFDVIQTSIPYIYHSALPSLPTRSQLLQRHVSELTTEARVIGGVGSSWNACLRTIQVSRQAKSVAFSPNGKLIASSIPNMGVQIFDAITGVRATTLQSHLDDDMGSLMFSPVGSLIACSSKSSIMLWDIQTGGLVRKLEGHTDLVRTVAFSPSGTTLVSGGKDSDIRVWNPALGNCDGVIKDHSSPIYSLCWLSDALVASGSSDGLVKLWDIPSRRWLKDFSSHTKRVWSVSCSADGSKLASASRNLVKVYDVSTGATLKTIPIDSYFVSLSPKGDRLVCGKYDLHIWDLSRDVRLTIPRVHGGYLINSACISPNATLIASAGLTVKLWTTEFDESLDSHSAEVNCMCFSEDGSLIASGSDDGTVKIWDTTSCSCLFTLSPDMHIISIAFSPNRTLVGAGSYGAVWIWDVESQKLRARTNTSLVEHIRFSPDESKLVSVSRDGIQVWDAESGSLLAFNHMHRSIEWITFSDGDEIVVQADGKLEKLKLCAVSTSSPTIDPSEEMAATSTPFDLVLSTDDEPTNLIPPPSHSYRLLQERSREWNYQWIVDSQGRRVFHWLDARVSACHMRKFAVGTYTGRVAIVDFSNITY